VIKISDFSSLKFCNCQEALNFSKLKQENKSSIEEINKEMHLTLKEKEKVIVITRGKIQF